MQPQLHAIFFQDFHNRSKLLVRPCLEEWGPDSPKKVLGLQYISLIMIICKWKKSAPNLGSEKCRVGHPCAVWLLAPYPLQQASLGNHNSSQSQLEAKSVWLHPCPLVETSSRWKCLGWTCGPRFGAADPAPYKPKLYSRIKKAWTLTAHCILKQWKLSCCKTLKTGPNFWFGHALRSGGLTARKKHTYVLDLIITVFVGGKKSAL